MHVVASSSGGSAALGAVVWIVIIALYWAPTIAGAISRKHNLGVIAVWNLFAFFFGFPWIMAWVKVAEKPQQPVVVYGGYAPPPGFQPPQHYGPPQLPVQPLPQARDDTPR
jgi:hypothetical protein